MDRRYNDEEVSEIFRLAAEATEKNQPLVPTAEGMTLAEMQAIGREVGISGEELVAASRAVDLAARPTVRRFLGLPVGVGLDVDLHRNLSDAEWDQLVVDLRETFDARGQQKKEGAFRQWTNGNLQVLVEPTSTGNRVRFRTVKGNAREMMSVGLGLLAFTGFTALARMDVGGAQLLTTLATPSAVGAALFGWGFFRIPGWARKRQLQMQQVAARLALAPRIGSGNTDPG